MRTKFARNSQELRMKNVPEALDRSTKLLTVERLTYAYKEALASAESLRELAKIRDAAEAFRLLLKYRETGGDMSILGTEIQARADRRMGVMLTLLERKRGRTKNSFHLGMNSFPDGEEVPSPTVGGNGEDGGSDPAADIQTPLAQIMAVLQIGPTEAWRWQQLAHIPDDLFDDIIVRTKREHGEPPIAIC